MLKALGQAIGTDCDLGVITVDAGLVDRFRTMMGIAAGPQVPLGLALALCGGPRPAAEFEPDVLTVHAGHALTLERPFVPARYQALARVTDVYEKSGRSGHLVVVARRAELRNAAGDLVIAVDQSEIARRLRPAGAPAPRRRAASSSEPSLITGPLELGETVVTCHQRAPGAEIVARYAASVAGGEPLPLFTDAAFAQRAGFADVIVPGPVQSAQLEALLAAHLPEWQLVHLNVSFRVSLVAGEPVTLLAVVTELEPHAQLVLDLTIENAAGERAAVGTATLLATLDHGRMESLS